MTLAPRLGAEDGLPTPITLQESQRKLAAKNKHLDFRTPCILSTCPVRSSGELFGEESDRERRERGNGAEAEIWKEVQILTMISSACWGYWRLMPAFKSFPILRLNFSSLPSWLTSKNDISNARLSTAMQISCIFPLSRLTVNAVCDINHRRPVSSMAKDIVS